MKVDVAAEKPSHRKRPLHTRWLVLALLPAIVLISPPPGRSPYVLQIMEVLGVACLAICLAGRGWSSVYVAGRKNQELVTAGPYSLVRNPLYVFSFIGLVGIGLISGMFALLLVAAGAFVVYYRSVVRREEAYLAGRHGELFASYVQTVPRWWPRFAAWRDVPALEIKPGLIGIHLRDSSLFFLAFVFFKACELARDYGLLRPLLYLP
jgi:protein-S-isoprenylcysteine O-methyltransferase Ste14